MSDTYLLTSYLSNICDRYEFRYTSRTFLHLRDLDYKTDTAIQTSLRHEMRDVTQLIIAHRLQTIMDADKIASPVAVILV